MIFFSRKDCRRVQSLRIFVTGAKTLRNKTESSAKAKEEINMDTNMKENSMNELNISEMEQASGGILPILLGLGTLALGGVIIAVMPDKKK